MRGGARSARGGSRADAAEPVSPGDVAWLLAAPCAALTALAVAALASPLGAILFARPDVHYWNPSVAVRKPGTQAAYLLVAAAAVAYGAAIAGLGRRPIRMRRGVRRAILGATEAAVLAFVLACWLRPSHPAVVPATHQYFNRSTVIASALLTAAVAAAVRWRGRIRRAELVARLGRIARSRRASAVCVIVAVLATVVWLLPALYSDAGIDKGPDELLVNAYVFDEASAVLDHRSPLVNMATYASLWPYVTALPLRAFGGTYLAFTASMATITGLCLLAVYDVLRRAVRSAALGLALYLPCLATGFFTQEGTSTARYDPGNYFGMFPLRYAGPYFLACLTARHIDLQQRRSRGCALLFVVAGLSAVNNLDFGLAALAATAVALLACKPPGRDWRPLARDAAVGLGCALALVCALTLLRAGSLPDPGLLTRYGRVFVVGGFGNVDLSGIGLHMIVTLTFVAAIATAGARAAGGHRDVLTGMLAWSGVFGFGANAYFYLYRSVPEVLLNVFSIWSVALALLLVATLRAGSGGRRIALPGLMALFGFGLAVCSLPQLPPPGAQLRRIRADAGTKPFSIPTLRRVIARETSRGERVVVLAPVGHRVARDAGVVDVAPYTGFSQMPAREQLDETLAILEREHGRKVFVAARPFFNAGAALARHGFQLRRTWSGPVGWADAPVSLYERPAGDRRAVR